MQNSNEGGRQPAQPEETIPSGSGETAGKPCSTPWCENHEAEGWCRTRIIVVGEAHLEISNGTQTGEPKLYGLTDFLSDGVPLGLARQVADALNALLEAVDAEVRS